MKIRNSNLVILLEHQNIKSFLKKAAFHIGLKNFLGLKKLKALCHGYILKVILKTKKVSVRFTKKNYKIKSKRV